ncbi:MAG: flippase-like domain-containing protein [Bacteroidetes bacterium]|nr:flippase-like domain-containing protein [Bacteroidota bacterium]
MQENSKNPLSGIKRSKIIYPIVIGLAVVGYMLYKNFDVNAFEIVEFTTKSVFWLFIAILLMITRDVGYIIRIKILTDNKLSWLKAFKVIMLWEFTSAITPSAIGGTSVAILYVNKEGLSVGKSAAVVMATSFLDELYFIIMFPLLFIVISPNELFSIGGDFSITNAFLLFAMIGYGIKFIYTAFLSYGLFKNPRGLKWILLWFFKFPIIRKWRYGANKAGTDIIKSSKELKNKPFLFWIKAFGATFLSWTARYWVVNALFLTFFAVKGNFLLFARQLVMWIMMLVSPTPGGSGFTEFVFSKYLSDFLPSPELAIVMALLWRLITYYPYLIMGVFIMPKWIKEHFSNKQIPA